MTGYYPHEVGIGTSRYNTLAVFVLRDCQVIAFGRSIRKHDQSGAFLSVFSGASGIPPRHNQQRSRVLLGGVKLEDIFHAEQEMCRMGSAASTAVYYAQRERKTRALLLHYADAKGELQETFKALRVTRNMRLSWLQRWKALDDDCSRLVDYKEFVQGCKMPDDLWSWRAFLLLDRNFTGSVDFFTFFCSLPRLLVFDRSNAMETAFRLCSRRGATCDPASAVLDEKDIRYIVANRYPILDPRRVQHRALEIMALLDSDCSGGISYAEFEEFSERNPIFLTAIQRTLQSLRRALFGEQFWKDFTNTAKTFDKLTRAKIFCTSQVRAGYHSDDDDEPIPDGPATAVARRAAAAVKMQLQDVSLAAAHQKKRRTEEADKMMRNATGKLRRVVSESNLGTLLVREVNQLRAAAGEGKTARKHLRKWASVRSVRDSEDAFGAGTYARTGARAESPALGRAVSASDLTANDMAPISKDQLIQRWTKDSLSNTRRWAKSIKAAEVQNSLRVAGKHASERLRDGAREVSHARDTLRELSTTNIDKTRAILEDGKRELSHAKKIVLAESTQRKARAKEFVQREADILGKRINAAKGVARVGRLKAAGTTVLAIGRMKRMAEAARKAQLGDNARSIKMVAPNRQMVAPNRQSLARIVSAFPRHVPDARTAKGVARRAVKRSRQTLVAFRRAAQLVGIVRYLNDVQGRRRRDRQGTSGKNTRHLAGVLRPCVDGDEEQEDLLEGTGGVIEGDSPWDILTGSKAKARADNARQQHWAMTEQFYDRLATATERLESRWTPERGYDFSADFPSLWSASIAHSGSGDTNNARQRRGRRPSVAKKTARGYLTIISLWQNCGDPCRSKLEKAFNLWRLNICDAAAAESSERSIFRSKSETRRDLSTGDSDVTPYGGEAEVTRGIPRQSVVQMWEAAGGASVEQDFHEIIMAKERADRPLPSELCDAYEREMTERINRRQSTNNVPILPMPIC